MDSKQSRPARPPARAPASRRAASRPGAAEDLLDPGPLPGLLGYRLRLAQQAVFRDFQGSVGELGISPGRAGMLLLVDANPGLSQSRLARAIGLDRSTLVPILDDLERRGWLERRPGADRRSNGLALTPSGRRFLASLRRRVEAHEQRVAARLSEREREQLLALLARVAGEG